MRQREIYLTGKIGTDGKVRLDMSRLTAFAAGFKGCRICASFRVMEPECSESIKTYYLRNVVPQVRQAMYDNGERYSDEAVERMLRDISPVCHNCIPNTETGTFDVSLKELNELSNAELVEHIETVRQYVAENYYILIEEPSEFLR